MTISDPDAGARQDELIARVEKLEGLIARLALENLDLVQLLDVLVRHHRLDQALPISARGPETPSSYLDRIWHGVDGVAAQALE